MIWKNSPTGLISRTAIREYHVYQERRGSVLIDIDVQSVFTGQFLRSASIYRGYPTGHNLFKVGDVSDAVLVYVAKKWCEHDLTS